MTRSVRPFRRAWAAAAILLFQPAPATNAQASQPIRPPGDIDGDLHVTVRDALEALKMLTRQRTFTPADLAIADVSPSPGPNGRLWGDGLLTVADVIRILRRAVGIDGDPWPGGPPAVPMTLRVSHTLREGEGPYFWEMGQGVLVVGRLIDDAGRALNARLVYFNSTQQSTGSADANAQGGFTLSLRPGVYNAAIVSTLDTGSGSSLRFSSPMTAKINALSQPGPLVFQRTGTPAVSSVTGIVTTVPAGYTVDRVIFTDAAHAQDQFPPPLEAQAAVDPASGRFTVSAPDALYRASLHMVRSDGAGSLTVVTSQTVRISSGRTLALSVPPLGSLSGTAIVSGESSAATGLVIAAGTVPETADAVSLGTISAGRYFLPLQANATYEAAYRPGSSASGSFIEYVPSSVSVSGNLTRNITIARPPVLHPITFWTGDAFGRPVAYSRIKVRSKNLSDSDPHYRARVDAVADSQGVATLSVPNGVYDILIEPAATLSSVEPLP